MRVGRTNRVGEPFPSCQLFGKCGRAGRWSGGRRFYWTTRRRPTRKRVAEIFSDFLHASIRGRKRALSGGKSNLDLRRQSLRRLTLACGKPLFSTKKDTVLANRVPVVGVGFDPRYWRSERTLCGVVFAVA